MGSFRRFPGSWRRLGDVPADRTRAAIDEITRALRTISNQSVGPTPCRFAWEDDGSMLVTTEFATAVALRPTDLSVIVFSLDGHVLALLPLHGRSPAELAAWLKSAAQGAKWPAQADESDAFDASDRSALSEAARWLNNAADVLDHLGLVGQLDPQTGHFAAVTKSGEIEISLQWAAGASGQDRAVFPAFVATGSTPGFLQAGDLAHATASDQSSRVEAFLSGLADSTR